MAVASTERFTDNEGNGWKFVWVAHAGGLRLFLTDPSGRETELRSVPDTPNTPRPSVDAETPLPLEIP